MADEDKEVSEPAEHEPEDDYEAASHSTADYAKFEKPGKKRSPIWRKLKKLTIGLAVLVVLAGLGGGAYLYLKNHKSTEPAKTTATEQTITPAVAKISATTKHYDSTNFGLGFDYPDDWKVTDSGGGLLTAASPDIKLKSAANQTVTGQIILSIRSKVQKLTEFDSGNASAAIASLKVDYTKPTQSQRGSTYLSFLRYANSNNASGLDGIYITGDNGYTLGQAIPKVDVQKVDPIISISFTKCTGTKCDAPLDIAASAWDDAAFSGPLQTLLKSLTIN